MRYEICKVLYPRGVFSEEHDIDLSRFNAAAMAPQLSAARNSGQRTDRQDRQSLSPAVVVAHYFLGTLMSNAIAAMTPLKAEGTMRGVQRGRKIESTFERRGERVVLTSPICAWFAAVVAGICTCDRETSTVRSSGVTRR